MRSLVVVRRRGGASLAVHPAGIAIAIVLLFPDRHAVLDRVDDEATRIEGLASMRCADADPDRHVGEGEPSDAMDAQSVPHGKARGGLLHDARSLFDREGLERLVLERGHL